MFTHISFEVMKVELNLHMLNHLHILSRHLNQRPPDHWQGAKTLVVVVIQNRDLQCAIGPVSEDDNPLPTIPKNRTHIQRTHQYFFH